MERRRHEAVARLDAKIAADILSDDPYRVEAAVAALASLTAHDKIPWNAVSNLLNSNVSLSPESPSSWARVYRAVFEVAKKVQKPLYVAGLRKIANIIEQNPQMMHPRHILDIAQDYYSDHLIPAYLRQGIVGSLGYALRFFEGSDFEGEIARRLNFEDSQEFSSTARFLEIVPALYNVGDEYSYSGDNIVIQRVQAALEDAVHKQKGSYLLKVRARLLLEQMDGREFVDSDRDRRPFILTGSQYAWHFEDGIHVATQENSTRVKALIDELDKIEEKITPPQHLIDEAIARGEDHVGWQPEKHLTMHWKRLHQELSSLFDKKLQPSHVYKEAAFGEQNSDEYHDYEYLLTKTVRETVEGEFGFKLSDTSLQEQFSFLSFIKTEDALGIQEVQRFVRAYGKDGLRAFLVMEHDPQFASEIVWTGNLLLEGVMTEGDPFFKEILAAYGRVLDGVNVARDVYRQRVGAEMSEEEYERVGAALRQRATSILQKAVRSILGDTETNADGGEEVNLDEMRKNLQQVEAEVVVLTCMLRALNLDPTSLKGSELQEIPGGTLRGLFKAQMEMLAIQEKQYRGRTGYSNDLVDALNAALSEAMTSSGTRFFVYNLPFTTNDPRPRVGGFFRLDTRGEGKNQHLHLASVMLDPALEGGKIVEGILQKTLVRESASLPILAECDPRSGITQKYIEWGFVASGTDIELGLTIFNIEWDAARNARLETTADKVPQARIIDRAEKGAVSSHVKYYAGDEPPKFQEYFDKGYLMTRFFSRKQKGIEKYYAAFELPPED